MAIYAFGLSASFWLAWKLRFDFQVPNNYQSMVLFTALWIIPIKLFFLAVLQQYSGLLSYFSIRDLIRLFAAMAFSSVIIILLSWVIDDTANFMPPRGVILIDFVLSFMGLASIRLGIRLNREKADDGANINQHRLEQVGIVGAGHSGANLVKELYIRKGLGMEPKYFFDDNPDKRKSHLHGIPIIGKPEILLDPDFSCGLDKLIIALPSISGRRIKEVVNIANKAGLTCEIVPSMEELTTGRVKVSKLRRVQIQDLLRRNPVQLQAENIKNLINGNVVIVTGAGGSIGSEVCRQIVNYNPKRLLLVDQCEVQLFSIQQELIERGCGNTVLSLVVDVLDLDRMESIFKRYKPNLVYHAAAHKHVSLMEYQPAEAFRNNTQGTIVMAEIAARHAVDLFLFISSDKAINPTSVMGASKRLAEIFLQSLHAANNTSTKFMAVRFGNVLGSSGSVVPIFEKQIDEGGPVTVTHPEVTRYFMTIPEAVGLILQAASQAKGGEIFVLDMGHPIKIIDLAQQLIELHGHKLGTDIEIEYTGLKPGEKLFEEISHKGENLKKTDHPKILRFVSEPVEIADIRKQIQEIGENLHHLEPDQIKLKFKKVIPEYQPFLT
uniref:Predicted nucleoside-diphosphate sugar epimerases n=1 Tax=uncultured verrucomicrobium HF0500_08N17 TaxID=723597 RepID=E7C4X7_9BACT|nr:predicted nucleoside-diphosphate sugar epimerases [uncultured verrucomicrobium HF0500_08N17]